MTQTAEIEPRAAVNADGVLWRLAKRKIGIFRAFPEFDEHDLFQEARAAVAKAMPRYDPAKGHLSTFVYTVGGRRILDLYRARVRQGEREAVSAIEADAGYEQDGLSGSDGDDLTLEDWLTAIYSEAKRRYPRVRQGQRRYSIAQAVAVTLLRRRFGWSLRAAALWFANNPDMGAVLGLVGAPSYRFFERAEVVTANLIDLPDE